MVKVSVVVPTYRSGEGLDRVVASLDAQTMPTDDFEVVFVDDGSPDDTHDRLLEVASTRPHVRVEQIEGSGWASRPRNVGQDLARGEYVLFMDHDDELYPDGLERAHAFGAPHGADVINPKEVRTTGFNWGMDVWARDRILTGDDLHVRWMYPMTPHKLYRTAFLREHGIRFREGARILWEDIYFNTEVYSHLETLALYGSTPVYRWVIGTGANNSATFTDDVSEWWDNIEQLVDFALSGVVDGDDLRFLVQHQYVGRILHRFARKPHKRPAETIAEDRRRARALVSRIPTDIDPHLPPSLRARSTLLRAERYDELERVSRAEAETRPTVRLIDAAWERGGLRVETRTVWETNGRPLALREADGRVLRDVPGASTVEAWDVTDDVPRASSRLSVRERTSRAGRIVTTDSRPRVDVVDGIRTLVVDARAWLPLADDDVAGLRGGTWELSARTSFMGIGGPVALRDDVPTQVALVGGAVGVLYSSRHGVVTVDTDQRVRRVVGSAGIDTAAAFVRGHGGSRVLVIPVDAHVEGSTRLSASVLLRRRSRALSDRDVLLDATVVADAEHGARIEVPLRGVPTGSSSILLVREGARRRKTGLSLRRVPVLGSVRVDADR